MSLGVAEERIVVSGNGPIMAETARPEEFREKHSIAGPMVLFLGQHYDYKGFIQMLQAAPSVWARQPDTHFVFIGPDVGNSEAHFTRTDPRVHRLGKVSLQEKSDALAAATLLCVPSTQEAFGGVYVEAWHYGRPVIGCRIPAVSEVISDGVDGLLVDQEMGQIADAIIEMIEDPSGTDAMGAAGKLKVEQMYGWEALARNTIGAYRTAIRGVSARR
jgi:glycosyltransferase involved in cell wall biosynthesis